MNDKQATLLRQAANEADRHPDEFDMGHWVEVNPTSWCGTTGCLAYEICKVADKVEGKELLGLGPDYVKHRAIEILLELGPAELSEKAIMTMFTTATWPGEAQTQYYHESRGKGVKNMVERFIAGEGSFNPPPIKQAAENTLREVSSQPTYLDNSRTPELE